MDLPALTDVCILLTSTPLRYRGLGPAMPVDVDLAETAYLSSAGQAALFYRPTVFSLSAINYVCSE
jgi:hypothetical protein